MKSIGRCSTLSSYLFIPQSWWTPLEEYILNYSTHDPWLGELNRLKGVRLDSGAHLLTFCEEIEYGNDIPYRSSPLPNLLRFYSVSGRSSVRYVFDLRSTFLHEVTLELNSYQVTQQSIRTETSLRYSTYLWQETTFGQMFSRHTVPVAATSSLSPWMLCSVGWSLWCARHPMTMNAWSDIALTHQNTPTHR